MNTSRNKHWLMCLPVLMLGLASQVNAGGLSTQLGEVVVENLQVGRTYNLSQLANLKLIVTNTSDFPVNLKMDILYPESSELRLGASAIPDTSWITLSQSSFKLAQSEKAAAEIRVSIPDNGNLRGRKYQVTIWSHTTADENAGMTLAYGLKTRLIFTIDTADVSDADAVTSSAARCDFTLKPEEIRLDNVPSGSLYDVEKEKGVVLEITNPSDFEQSYIVQSLPVSASVATLVTGFSDTPDAAYLKFSHTRIVVGPHQTKSFKMYLEVPAKPENRGKHFMFVVSAVAEGGDVVASVYSRLLTSIQ